MMHERNVEGLRQNAQRKRKQAFERAEQGIRQLFKDGRPINFETVAEVSGVSKAWLYREPEIKERIEQLRAQGAGRTPAVPKPKASDTSKEAINKTLKERIRRLEAEVRGLREHIEVITGQNYLLEEENARLKKQLVSVSQTKSFSKGSSISSQISTCLDFKQEIQAELEQLGIKENSTLRKEINRSPEDVVWKAIELLKQRQAIDSISNPAGFLLKAIKGKWEPNEKQGQHVENELFNEWYKIAKSLSMAIASCEQDGVLHIYTDKGEAIPFQKMLDEYPLEKLRQMDIQ